MFGKGGALDDFDVHRFLDEFEGNTAELHPSDPAFYLRAVRTNPDIQAGLRRLPSFHAPIEALCRNIDAGRWDTLSHRPDDPAIAAHAIKDVLLYAHLARRISRAEFGTALLVLNVKEQVGLEIEPRYRDHVLGKSGEAFAVPVRKARFLFANVFDPDTAMMTPEGEVYLDTVAANLMGSDPVSRSLPAGSTHADIFGALAEVIGGLPPNLQMFAVIENLAGPRRPTVNLAVLLDDDRDPQLFFDRQINPEQMPFNASQVECAGGEVRNDVIYVPNSGIMSAALSLLSDHVVKPVYLPGRLSIRQVARLHAEGFHPVIVRDTRIRNNYLNPHGRVSGTLDAAMHDECFHCLAASTYSPWQRDVCCLHLPDAIDAALEGNEDVFLEQSAERLVCKLADLVVVSPTGAHPVAFFLLACQTAVRELDLECFRQGKRGAAIFQVQLEQLAAFRRLAILVANARPDLISSEQAHQLLDDLDTGAEVLGQQLQVYAQAEARELESPDEVDPPLPDGPPAGPLRPTA